MHTFGDCQSSIFTGWMLVQIPN